MAGAKPYYYPLVAEHDFLPYVKDIPEEVAKKARYMVVSLPSNPVGSIATPGLYEEIVEFARKYDILIIHDNAYSDIIFDGAHGGSFLSTEGAREVGVEFSVSYTHLEKSKVPAALARALKMHLEVKTIVLHLDNVEPGIAVRLLLARR